MFAFVLRIYYFSVKLILFCSGEFKDRSHCYACSLRIEECASCLYDETTKVFTCNTCTSGDVITSA